jgi:hypothetical protein
MSLVLTKSTRNPSKEQLQLPQQPETVLTISAQAGKKIHVILAESGRLYRLVDAKTGEIVRPLQLERQKRKLVIQLEGEQTVEILDFFDEVPGRAKSEYVIEGSSSESSSLSVSSDWALGTATSLEVTQVLWTPTGTTGNDVLQGGQGNDSLTGGLGADIFRFAKGDLGADTVADFSKTLGDKVDLSGLLQGSAFNALSNLSTYLQLSTDGSGNAVLKVDTYGESNFASPAQTIVFANAASSGLTGVTLATLFDERVFVA